MLRKFFASLATVALAIGIVATAAAPAQAGNTDNTNDPANWVAVAGETCVKWNEPQTTSLSYSSLVSYFALDGKTITKVIIKAGSSNGYPQAAGSVEYENQAYYTDATYKLTVDSTTWTQVGDLTAQTFTHYSGKTISHAIVCYTTPAPTSVSGSVTKNDQVCDDDELYDGWIAPVATTGVTYELYAADMTTVIASPFTTTVTVAPGTYWVKVLPLDSSYTVSEANTWIQVVVGGEEGACGTVEPTPVSGSVNAEDQTCDTEEYAYVSGWLEPVATTGVRYELYAADKTTLLDATFDAKADLAAGTYWVKVISTDPALYTVSEANTWIQKTVGEYEGNCSKIAKVIGDPVPFEGCVPTTEDELDPQSVWVATLTIKTSDDNPAGSVQYRVFFWNEGTSSWDDQGIYPEGTYPMSPGKVKVVAEAVGDYVLETPSSWEYTFQVPTTCDEETLGPIVPEVSFTNPTCSAPGSYTLTSPGPHDGLPAKTVTWYVNDVETEPGTHTVTSPSSVTIRVVATTGYTFETDEGFTTEIVFPTKSFAAPEACGDLTTLALTGNDVNGLLWITALLGLLGTALVRAGRRAAARG